MTFESSADHAMTRAEFAGFLLRLADSISVEPEVWENDTIERFLRAWAAWADDMDGYFINRGEPVPQELTWQLLAQMLLAARVYE